MGWFGMPGMDKKEAFNELFSQNQYSKPFKLIWEKHIGNKSIAVYSLDSEYRGETILWAMQDGELMYKPISWMDSLSYIPKSFINKLLQSASKNELKIYEELEKERIQKESIKKGTVIRLNSPITLSDGTQEDTFMYQSNGRAWAVDLGKFVSGISKKLILNTGFTIMAK